MTSICFVTKVEASELPGTFAKGADVSWLPQMEASNFIFKNDNGDPQDCLQILKDHGIDSIRIRTFVNPSNDPQSGHCSTAETVALAVRAKNMGFRIMLDFHYSDSWADPGKQNTPEAWKNDTLEQLKVHVYDYTLEVMNGLKTAGVTPEWVQVGNEINPGMLMPLGSTSNFSNLAQLVNSGYAAVKAVSPISKVIIHRSNGTEIANFKTFFDGLTANNAQYDVIGVSYYPGTDYTSSIDTLATNLNNLAANYGKEVMVAEIGGDCTDAVNVHNMLVAVQNKVLAVPGGKGTGVFYWEPEGAQSWSGYSMSAWHGNDGTADAYKPSLALDAFLPGSVILNPYPVTGINLNKTTTTVEVDGMETLIPALIPANSSFKGVIYTSDNTAVAKVDPASGIIVGVSVGTANITATTYDGGFTAICAVTVTPRTNLISNSGFELGLASWTVTGPGVSLDVATNSHSGAQTLHYYNGQATEFTVSQNLTGLANGTYNLSAWVDGGGGEITSEIFAVNGQNLRLSTSFKNTGWNIWTKPTIYNIEVTDGTLTIGAYYNYPAGTWGNIDEFVLTKNDDSALMDIKVNGTTVPGFDPAVTSYNVALAAGTTTVPTVTATVMNSSANAVVTPAATLPGSTTILVTAGSNTKTYTINFTVEVNNPIKNPGFEPDYSNWTVSDPGAVNYSNDRHSGLKALGYWKADPFTVTVSQTLTGLQNGTYNLSAWAQGAPGNITDQIFATSSKGKRLSADFINTGWAQWHKATISNIIIRDGSLTVGVYLDAPAENWGSYDDFVLIKTGELPEASKNANLSDLKVNGTTIDGFNPDTTNYEVELPAETTVIPNVTAIEADTGKAEILIKPLVSLPGTTTVMVTAEDGITQKTYSIGFTVAKIPVTSVTLDRQSVNLSVNGIALLTAKVLPPDATDKNVIWSSNKPEIAVVDNNGKVTAKGPGTAVMFVTTADGGKTASATVTVFALSQDGKVMINQNPVLNVTTHIATAKVPLEEMQKALELSEQLLGSQEVVLVISNVVGAKAYTQELPAAILSSTEINEKIKIITPMGSLAISDKMLNQRDLTGKATVSICIAKVDQNSKDKKNKVNKPVIELTLKVDNKNILSTNLLSPITVSLDYTPTAKELKNKDHVIIYYLNNDKRIPVSVGKYSTTTGKVTFSIILFGKYTFDFI